MVSGHAVARRRIKHPVQRFQLAGTAVDQIANENQSVNLWVEAGLVESLLQQWQMTVQV